jgi:hypothetical protein
MDERVSSVEPTVTLHDWLLNDSADFYAPLLEKLTIQSGAVSAVEKVRIGDQDLTFDEQITLGKLNSQAFHARQTPPIGLSTRNPIIHPNADLAFQYLDAINPSADPARNQQIADNRKFMQVLLVKMMAYQGNLEEGKPEKAAIIAGLLKKAGVLIDPDGMSFDIAEDRRDPCHRAQQLQEIALIDDERSMPGNPPVSSKN